jgi:hypothetical protein
MWDYYEREVIRGLESGPPIPLTPEYWGDFLRKRVSVHGFPHFTPELVFRQ